MLLLGGVPVKAQGWEQGWSFHCGCSERRSLTFPGKSRLFTLSTYAWLITCHTSHSFISVLYCCRPNWCRQGSTRVRKGVRWMQQYSAITWFDQPFEILRLKFWMLKFLYFIFSYIEASYEIYLHHTKISHCTIAHPMDYKKAKLV